MSLKTQVCVCRFVCGRASGVRAGNRDWQEISISCSSRHFQKPLKQGAPRPCSAICTSETAFYFCHFNFFPLLLTWRTNPFSVPCCQWVPAAQLLSPVAPEIQFNQWHEVIFFSPKPERTAQCLYSAPKTVVCWIFVHLPPSLDTSIIKWSPNTLGVHTHTHMFTLLQKNPSLQIPGLDVSLARGEQHAEHQLCPGCHRSHHASLAAHCLTSAKKLPQQPRHIWLCEGCQSPQPSRTL